MVTTKTLSSNEAKQQWGSVMSAVSNDGTEVIIESHGKPKAVVISYDEYQGLQQLRERQRRAKALEEFRALSEHIGDRNSDLTDEEIDELADRFAHEVFEDLAREGKIRFERDITQ